MYILYTPHRFMCTHFTLQHDSSTLPINIAKNVKIG